MYFGIPENENSFYEPETIYGLELHPRLIFVFGSNRAGRHGKGSALVARMRFGAVYGNGVGLQGRSYGIPTKSGVLKVLDLLVIESYVDDFLRFNREHEDMAFFVSAIGTMNAGYDHSQIAPMFKGAQRCWFDKRWQPYLL